jgi:glycine betaine/choline ABC-type transport system substrate-binding protein
MRFVTVLILAIAVLACSSKEDKIVVGSKNFSEQVLLGEILAQQIEKNTDLKVDRKLNLGGTFICHKALVAGEMDAYIEYTGTALTAILKHETQADRNKVTRIVKDEYTKQFKVDWLEPLGFNNTFAILVRKEDAERLNLKTISDLAHAPNMRPGFGYEFMERKDGFPGLEKLYGLNFKERPKTMDLMISYNALDQNKVDLISGNSTDGLIEKLGLVVLEDDKHYFPPYEAAPVVRQDTLARHPELRTALSKLAGTISEEKMRQLNSQVDVEKRDAKQVAAEFLKSIK